MRYVSTRGRAPSLSFEEAMMTGLARDGGLYVPEEIPSWSAEEIAALAGLPYEEVALRVLRPFVAGSFTDDQLRPLIARAYEGFGHPARAPLRQLAPNHFLLELFHGPTLAFKDFAMQLIGQLMQAALARSGERITIVGATSGDTGSAAIEAFRGLSNVDVFILFPSGPRVSEVQRRQMTTPGEDNVHALSLDGDFDACQARLKDMFNDHAFRDRVRLAGVNSINWARVLAQVVYYFTSAVALGAPHRPVSFTVPTGNFGDVFAGYVAKRMGLPIDRLVVATNQNDILHRTLQTGEQRKAGVTPSISPSMDIQVSSNFERVLFDAYGRDGDVTSAQMRALAEEGGFAVGQGAWEYLREQFDSGRASEDETSATIARTRAATGETLCPHTAVGVHVAEAHLGAVPMITLATAHPAKFPDAVEAATGDRPPLPSRMADLYDRPERVTDVPDDLAALQDLILSKVSA
ncbi:threonine synthase [Wenxinia saemankumensis]|uniref:Threonine synthase n=1 Tax=Wenxinia saemankumensis TaxID=1447782 RepID=A0A1M6GVW7_9RHOB|nr:threonine synthase [Wenxinia saemankumensis]SHJ14107.1 L-threonine synthase [Wenxinia saemankumensis]